MKKIYLAVTVFLFFAISACSLVKESRQQTNATAPATDSEMSHSKTLPIIDNGEQPNTPDLNGALPPAAVSEYRQTATRYHDLLHTKLDVSFDWEKKHLQGKATLTLKPYFFATDSVTIDAKGFDLNTVALLVNGKQQPLSFRYDSMQLHIQLGKAYARTDTFTLFIDYTAKPNELADSDPYITYDNKGLYFINPDGKETGKPTEIWTQGETEAASCWFPTIDHPNERTTQEINITVPDKYKTLSNGTLISSVKNPNGTRTDYWKQAQPHAPYLFAMSVNQYAVVKDTWRGKEVNYYVDTAYAKNARNIFGNTPEMLEFFSNKLNYPFPWDKYSQAVVYDFVAGAMENTTATLFYEDVYYNSSDEDKGKNDDIVSHELFHQWFGDLVTCESWSNLPLNESFATYGEYLWFEYKYGKEQADYHLDQDLKAYLAEAFEKKEPLIRFHYLDREDMFDRHSYQKGGRVLHMLRNYVGDDAFFAALNLYLTQNAYQSVEIHNLRLAFETVTGQDLNWFFNQWFFTPGHPVLNINYQYDSLAYKLIVHIDQTQPENQVYRLPTNIAIHKADGTTEIKDIEINKRQSVFEFALPAKPLTVIVDPNHVLLCERYETHDMHGYLNKFYKGTHFLDQTEAITALASQQENNTEAAKLFLDALQHPFWLVRQTAIENIAPGTKNNNNELKNRLIQMVKTDSNDNIKIAALSKLAEVFPDGQDLLPVFSDALNSNSHSLIATALYHLPTLFPAQAMQKARQLQNHPSSEVAAMVAKIYSQFGDDTDQPYFEDQLTKLPDYNRYTIIDSYGFFLSRMYKPDVILKGITTLANIAITDHNWWIRLVATQQLAFVKDVLSDVYQTQDAVNQTIAIHGTPDTTSAGQFQEILSLLSGKLEKIKNTETDERLLQQYKNL